jgi:hypothetical protein
MRLLIKQILGPSFFPSVFDLNVLKNTSVLKLPPSVTRNRVTFHHT